MRQILILLLIVVMYLSGHAQKQTYNWAFGLRCGLTWNTTRDVAVTGLAGTPDATLTGLPNSFSSSISTMEGCFSLSDANGNLLFYSDGMTIWNKNNQAMVNGSGMTGNNSSAQSGIIVPYPGDPDKYMAVTLGMNDANNVSYSIVNMTLGGGLGDVVASQKNIRFQGAMGNTGESVTSVRHANGTDYWILASGRGNPTYFNAWLLTSSGVSTSPVVTTSPVSVAGGIACGYLKITADGKHFVWSTFNSANRPFVWGDFDNSTGKFSNIKLQIGFNSPYGVEFSPNQKLVYLATGSGFYVYKADELFATSDISKVTQKYYAITTPYTSALQLGPDKRIYWPHHNTTNMRIIDNPDDFDNLRIYQTPNGFVSGTVQIGLPSFAASWFAADIKEKSFLCTGNDFKFTVEISMSGPLSDQPSRLVWDFGDNSGTVSQNIVTGTTTYRQTHNYASTGKYIITIAPYKADGTALSKTTLPANVVDCVFQTNPMIRVDLLNTAQQLK
ncbi:hypothetical protein CLV62_102224 [Dysgonomonas alginatilytica]|uniref:PKD domain-containing protein n=1 Tax=Dysgonomonas alginatilytica TaxID=1605892 RepID=A0A2V3PUE2_9BACT|nr:hypothetical protein [Dysgonomonas alginatilytica]PXV68192.1 hypothetical protein CLV62_102224 [Dysgonomonas alginatilytica]